MGDWVHVMKMLAGIAMFLFAMQMMEGSIKSLSARNFKRFLQRISSNGVGAVIGGAVITALLQSSSLVSLMVLAFVGSGILPLRNALAIILGANLGTTLDSWLVAILGFKMNIEILAYPAIAVAGILIIMSVRRQKLMPYAYLLAGFGLLFIGLSFMKTSMEIYVTRFDFAPYRSLPSIAYLGIGFLITSVIQSSSATMALTLSALNSGMVGFEHAAAVVLGSETGTTIKVMLGALGGDSTKKQVALGNFLFNGFITFMAFIFLRQILNTIQYTWAIRDPLMGLVTFSTLTNLAGILVVLPVLKPFSHFLERFFKSDFRSASSFICFADAKEPQTAMDLFKKETEFFIYNSMLFNLHQMSLPANSIRNPPEFERMNAKRKWYEHSLDEQYEFLKHVQGELQMFYLELRQHTKEGENTQLNQWVSAIRGAMHGVKSMRDIERNILNLNRSSHDLKYGVYQITRDNFEALYKSLDELLFSKDSRELDIFLKVYKHILENYYNTLNHFYSEAERMAIQEMDVTSILNYNRELFTSNKAMLMAVKDCTLQEKEAREFNEWLVYAT